MDIMLGEFNKGLGKETNPTAKVKMYPTYVRDVPDGSGKTPFHLSFGGLGWLPVNMYLLDHILILCNNQPDSSGGVWGLGVFQLNFSKYVLICIDYVFIVS